MKLSLRKWTRCSYDREAAERQAAEDLERQMGLGKPPVEEWAELEARLSDIPVAEPFANAHTHMGSDVETDADIRPEDDSIPAEDDSIPGEAPVAEQPPVRTPRARTAKPAARKTAARKPAARKPATTKARSIAR